MDSRLRNFMWQKIRRACRDIEYIRESIYNVFIRTSLAPDGGAGSEGAIVLIIL